MAFMSGSRESDPPAQVPLAGIKDLTPAGDQLFLNAVCFMATCGPPLVAGDTNGNGMGGEFPADFNPIRDNFRKTVTSRAAGDLVTNGRVDFADFREWKTAHLGMGGSLEGLDLSFVANVPEPQTLTLLITVVASLVARRRPACSSYSRFRQANPIRFHTARNNASPFKSFTMAASGDLRVLVGLACSCCAVVCNRFESRSRLAGMIRTLSLRRGWHGCRWCHG